MCDAVFDVDADSGDGSVEVFVVVGAGLVGQLLDRGDGGGGDVGGVGDPGGAGGVEEVLPTTQVDGLRVVSGSRYRVGDGDEVTAVGIVGWETPMRSVTSIWGRFWRRSTGMPPPGPARGYGR